MMKMKRLFLSGLLLSVALAANAQGQTAPTTPATATTQTDAEITPNRVSGDVMAINAGANGLSLKTAAGHDVVVVFDDKTTFLRAQPGATKLEGATKIALADVSVGDRVLALGRVAADQKSVPARYLVVMTKADIARKQEHDRAEWQRRGVLGVVTAVNPAAREATISVRSREGVTPVVVAASDKTQVRRYAPDTVRFADAKTSSFAELKVGDQLRALGERSPDGSRFTPEEVVAGSFRTLLGTVSSVDVATNQIKITNTQTKQPMSVVVSADSNLRRLPPMLAEMMARRAQGGGSGASGGFERPGGGGSEGRRTPPAAASSSPSLGAGNAGNTPTGGGRGPGAGGMRRAGGGGFDVQDMLERLPTASLAELKPGDVILVASTAGTDPTRVTAITLLAGADALLNMMQAQGQRPAGSGPGSAAGISSGLPAGIDIGIGLP